MEELKIGEQLRRWGAREETHYLNADPKTPTANKIAVHGHASFNACHAGQYEEQVFVEISFSAAEACKGALKGLSCW